MKIITPDDVDVQSLIEENRLLAEDHAALREEAASLRRTLAELRHDLEMAGEREKTLEKQLRGAVLYTEEREAYITTLRGRFAAIDEAANILHRVLKEDA